MGRRAGAGIDTGKLALLERFGSQMLATARRYSANSHDAEDAYQRATEILLTHDPRGSDDELCRWLRTTVKHEALAIRRRGDRLVPAGEPERLPMAPTNAVDTEERAQRFERLRQGAEALRRLKPQEVRCLLLRAEGFSYQEICAETGFTYTKVNRCLTEGRRAFAERLAAIESGAECAQMTPLLSLVADGEARATDLALLRPHLRACPGCRARLAEYRTVAPRVAALVPPAILIAGAGRGPSLRGPLESVLGAVQDRAAALGERAHQAAELAAGQKVAAVAASAAALAGGPGATTHDLHASAPPAKSGQAARPYRHPPGRQRAVVIPVRPVQRPHEAPRPVIRQVQARPVTPPSPPAPAPAGEFAPSASTAAHTAPGTPSPSARRPAQAPGGQGAEFAP